MDPITLAYKLEELSNTLTLVVAQNPLLDQVEEVRDELNKVVEKLGRDI